jgi:predicted metalloprotease
VYLNTGFFAGIARVYGLRSGFAAGYITAHEVAHHVQTLVGLLGAVRALDARAPAGANARSVRLELQADCYAGVWLHTVQRRDELSEGDLRDIVRAAEIVGADYQAQRAGGTLMPETWTHGTSAQRVHWLGVGLRGGDPAACDTFGTPEP